MKTKLMRSPQRAGLWCGVRLLALIFLGLTLSVDVNAFGQATIATLAGGPNAGNMDGNTLQTSLFNFPAGIALDPSDTTLFVADYNNNAIREITDIGDTATSYTFSPYTSAVGINHPIAVAVDAQTNIFVLNQGSGNNGSLMEFNGSLYVKYQLIVPMATNAMNLTNATALALDSQDNMYVTVNSNTVLRVTTNGLKSIVGVITNAGTSLRGIVVMDNGQIALSDAGNNGIWMMNPGTTNIENNATPLTGFHGAGDVIGPAAYAAFNSPECLAKAGNGVLVVADYNNNKVKVISSNGTVTRLFGVSSNYWYVGESTPGWYDGTVNPNESLDPVEARQPYGLAVAHNGTLYDSETYYCLIRQATGTALPPLAPPALSPPVIQTAVTNYGKVTLTWSAVTGASSYNVKRATSIGGPFTTITNVTATTFTDTSVLNGTTYFYVVSTLNSGNVESQNSPAIETTIPLPPVADPKIGYVTFDSLTGLSVFHQVSSAVFNNNALIVIEGAPESQTFYTYGATPTSTNMAAISDPTTNSASAPVGYTNGITYNQVVALLPNLNFLPDMTIKAIGAKSDGSPNSSIVQSRFQFVTGNPAIIGNNAAKFTLNDITTGAKFLYTTDGSDPRNSATAVSVGPASGTNGLPLSLPMPTDTNSIKFEVVAFKDTYQTSSVVSQVFTSSNFVANTISFGFASGEASSDFVGAPGQTFYAPITLNTLPNTKIYSLQFNVTVTNGGAATNISPAVPHDGLTFQSMLLKPLPSSGSSPSQLYTNIPPMMFTGGGFTNLEFTDTNLNLLGVGWVERFGETNLYDTRSQTLITYSEAHDDLFPNSLHPNGVIVGGYGFRIPGKAKAGDQYQIRIGRPSATDDGIGAPGSSVYIDPPYNTNTAALGGGTVNALKVVTVGQRKYLAGDAYPFRWFNAGDFGDSNLDNADVEQVFQSAVYALNYPPFDANSWNGTGFTNVSDFFDAMDSCGYTYVNSGKGYLVKNNAVSNTDLLFNGNDSTINQIAFGDGKLDVCDVYVTYRRSLDTSLTWFQRFWTNGIRAAIATNYNITPKLTANISAPTTISQAQIASLTTNPPSVEFSAGDIIGSAGQTVQVPIKANILGNYPLRVLMLNLTVEPLDGSPALTTPVQFTQTAPLGSPYTSDSIGNGNYSTVWLNSTITGLTGDVVIGTLSVTIPTNASPSSAYAVHFDHASASPNGLASFPRTTLTGLVTLSSRTNSTYGDGIPDSWRLRWFGTVNNLLSVSNACPSGDGVDNWMKYVAGVNPNVANDFPTTSLKHPLPSGASAAIQWPSVAGKQYIIQRSANLYSDWTDVATNTGTGGTMEFDDHSGGPVKFYRVRILP